MRIMIIGNPTAGAGRAGRSILRLEQALRGRGCVPQTVLTDWRGHATEIARDIEDTVDCLVVAGGDGTIHETINGLADPIRTPIAILRVGTANILAKDLNLPVDVDAVADSIVRCRVRWLDIGRLGADRRFLMVVSCGFDASVIRSIHENRRSARGPWGYPRPIFRTMLCHSSPRLLVQVDGGAPIEGAMVVVANTRTYAGVMSVADRARPDSGHFDVVVFPRGRLVSLMRYAWMSWRCRISQAKDVAYVTGTSVRIESADEPDVEVDGEYYGSTPVELTLQPAAVSVVVP